MSRELALFGKLAGLFGMCEARCETRASQEPRDCCVVVCCASRPYAASKVRLGDEAEDARAAATTTKATASRRLLVSDG